VTQEQPERQDQSRVADEDVVAREEAAAAAEAGEIGGRKDDEADEAMRPVSEGGGGEAEGFELSEEELRDEAEHGGGHHPPADAGEPEAEPPRTEYGEPDRRGSVAREAEPPEATEDA
jgi:hypothetical protein